MTRRALARFVVAWAALTTVLAATVHVSARPGAAPLPSAAARAWALDALDAAVAGRPVTPAPSAARRYHAAGPIVAYAWARGMPAGRFVGDASLVATVERAAQRFRADPVLRAEPRVVATLAVTRARTPFVHALAVPFADGLALVPLRDGLFAALGERSSVLTPDDMLSDGTYDRGLATPIPDLTLGANVPALVGRLALDVRSDARTLRSRGRVERLDVATVARDAYPSARRVDAESLLHAATIGARFLLRHQDRDGRFVYVYDARTARSADPGYSSPRHSGATYFLALLAHETHDADARAGARRGLAWLIARTQSCGAPERRCVVEDDGGIDLGGSALGAVAAAAYLEGGDDAEVRAFLTGIAAFLRAQQRPDGELMHGFDRLTNRPVDVQLMYYSGEGALALAMAGRVLHDRADSDAAARVLAHLTGEGWDFFGSRYYYGEEHWTCSAAAALRETHDTRAALDFCRRWAEWNRRLQYAPHETPWDVAGAYGAGNVVLPRLTPVASRSEAFVSTYELAAHDGVRDDALRPQIEAGLGALLRWQWDPGPTWLFADPDDARGGIPGSPADLTVRDDYLQHAGCAMVRWAHLLRSGSATWATP